MEQHCKSVHTLSNAILAGNSTASTFRGRKIAAGMGTVWGSTARKCGDSVKHPADHIFDILFNGNSTTTSVPAPG